MTTTLQLAPAPVVPGPVIRAPETAFGPVPDQLAMPLRHVESEPAKLPKWIAEKAINLPEPLYDAAAKVASTVNDVLFPSRPAGHEIARTDGSWTFAALGDYGVDRDGQRRVAATIAASAPDLLLTLGDNVYESGKEKEFRKHFDPKDLFGNLRDTLPVYPSLGNHDVKADREAKPYHRRFEHLGGARYYSFDHKGVQFTALDSNETFEPGSPQYQWLDQTLTGAGDDYKVVYFHHPLLSERSRAKDDPRMGHLAPLLAEHGVHLVVAGHDHGYERSRPLNDAGTVHITAGGGGRMLYPFTSEQADWSVHRDVDFGHLEVEVTPDALVGRYVLDSGKVGDTFSVPRVLAGAADAAAGAAALSTPAAS